MDFVKTNRIGKNLRLFSCLLFCLILVLGSSFQSLAVISSSSNAFAVNPDYLIGSASNADPYGIATMELTDEDYYIQPFSTLGTVTNTLSSNSILVRLRYRSDTSGTVYTKDVYAEKVNGRYTFSYNGPDGFSLYQYDIFFDKSDIPLPGSYSYSFDFASDFSHDYSGVYIWWRNTYPNAESQDGSKNLSSNLETFSGDVYVSNYRFNLTNVSAFNAFMNVPSSEHVNDVGGSFAFNFKRLDADPSLPSTGTDTSSESFDFNVSNSLNDISSSMDSAAENLEYISTSQNLIIQGIDNVIMHISDQLYAFWDQLYNLIHEPTYARLGDILDAIRNLDLEITVEMKEVTDAVNKMNQDMQVKLQNVQQTLTGGYDSSSMDSDNQELNSSLNEYEAAENVLFDDAKEHINSFEFDTDLGEFSTPLTDISYFLGSLFVGLGPMNVVISFSLTLTIAMVLIGWYRFKGGS